MAQQSWWRRWLNFGHTPSRPRTAGRRPGYRLRLEELEGRRVPATVQFNAASEVVNATAGTFSIPVTETVTPTVSTFASGFGPVIGPNSLAFDAASNLYVANFSGNTVSKVTPAGVVSTFASGLTDPAGLTFDAAGNLYVANSFGNTVSKVTPAGGVSTFASGFNDPRGLAFNGGNLYVANYEGNTVSKVTPAGVVSTFATGLNGPAALAFDAAGNLYVANFFGTTVSKVTPAGVVSTFVSGLDSPSGLTFDAAGNLYVANSFTAMVNKVTPAGVVSTFASGFDFAEGLAFDAAGNLYVATQGDALNYSVSKVTVPSVSVPFTLGGTATAGTDYSGITASPLVIPAGQTTATISGTLLANPGLNKTMKITLGTPTGASLGTPSVSTLTIRESVLTVQGTNGNDTFTFVAGSPSFYVLNGVTTTLPANTQNVVFVSNGGIDHAEVYGSGNDTANIAPTVVTDVGNGYTVELDKVAVANVHSSGANSSALFTLGASDIFVGRYDYSQMVQAQNTYYLGAVGFAQTTANALANTNSEAWMATAPTSSTDSLTGTPTSTTIQGTGYSSTANNFSFVAAFAGNNSSAKATLSTAPNDMDTMGGVPTYSFVQSGDVAPGQVFPYVIYAVSFIQVKVNGDSTATAYIATSNGSDTYVGTPTSSEVKGASYDIGALGFGHVYAYAGGTGSVAYLHSSTGSDTYVGTPTSSEVKGASYDIVALGFGTVFAYAGGTGSVAYLTTSRGNDNFLGTPSYSKATDGSSYTNFAIGFVNVSATAGSSNSTATFDDSPGTNTFTGTGSSALETGSGYAVNGIGFGTVNLESPAGGGGTDQANVSNITYTLNKNGNW